MEKEKLLAFVVLLFHHINISRGLSSQPTSLYFTH